MSKQTYLVKSLVSHDQKDYAAGKNIVLEDDEAEPLLAGKAIEGPVETQAEPKKPAK